MSRKRKSRGEKLLFKARITDKYIIKEIIPLFLLSVMLLTFTMILNKIILITVSVITKGISLSLILRFLSYMLPSIIVLTIPMSILVSIILAFGRLSSDSEITALKAGGCSVWKLLAPVYLFALVGYLLSTIVFLEVLPRSNLKAKEILFEIAREKVDAVVEPRIFIKEFEGWIVYVNEKLPGSSMMEGVFVADMTKPERSIVFIAKNGEFIPDPEEQMPILRVRDGLIQELSETGELTRTPFEFHEMDLKLPIDDEQDRTKIRVYKSEREMNVVELLDHLILLENKVKKSEKALINAKALPKENFIRKENAKRNYQIDKKSFNIGRLELHKKFAFPFACLIFPLIAVPFGIRNRKGGKFTGFAYSLLFFLFYYIFMTFGKNMGEEGKLNPILAMWLPNMISGIIGITFLILEARERAYGFQALLSFLKDNAFSAKIIEKINGMTFSKRAKTEAISRSYARSGSLSGMRMGRILDFYICKEFLIIALFVLLGILSIFNIVEIFEKIDDVIEHKASMFYLVKYLYYEQPQILGYIIPMVFLIATLLSIAILSKNNELIAIKASGISVFRFVAPIFLLGLAASFLNFGLHEKVIPAANKKCEKIWEVDIRENEPRGLSTQNQIWYRVEGNKIFHIALMIGDIKTLFNLKIFEFAEDFGLLRIVTADSAKWNEDGYWDLKKVGIRAFDSKGGVKISEKDKDKYYTDEKPEDFMREYQKPEEMSFKELRRYISKLEQTGYSTYKYKTDLYNKLAIPFTSFIMVLIAVPFALKVGKSGAMAGIGVSIAIGIAYIAIHSSFLAIGYSGRIPPFMAAFTGNVLFIIIAMYMMTRIET